jgi:hypothetical protein
LEIVAVAAVIHELLLRYSTFVRYWRKWDNASAIYGLGKPMIQLGEK